jgi:hypothetical protein
MSYVPLRPHLIVREHPEWKRMIEQTFTEPPLFVVLRPVYAAGPEAYENSIMRVIHHEKAENMKIKDVIKYCINEPRDLKEASTSGAIKAMLIDEYAVNINKVIANISLEEPILKHAALLEEKEMRSGRKINYYYTDIEVRKILTGGFKP